jgi:hypothetical protein
MSLGWQGTLRLLALPLLVIVVLVALLVAAWVWPR